MSAPSRRLFWARLRESTLILTLCLSFLSMTALATEPAGKGEISTDALAYVGLWHASPALGSGFSARLALNDDDTFLWAASEMDGLERVRFRSGAWTLGKDILRLTAEEEVRWEGGWEVSASGSMGTEIEIADAEVVTSKLTIPVVEEYELGLIDKDVGVLGQRTVTIGGIRYWELPHPMDLETLYDDYMAIKEQSAQPANNTAAAEDHPEEGTDRDFSSRLSGSIWLGYESEYTLGVGSICLFRNDEKESIPYRWRYHISDKTVIGFLHSEYEISAASLPMPGGDVGWRRFYFEALTPGECEIAFRYGRYGDEWDDAWDEEYRYTLVVTSE